jgi:hypothetical protein
VRILKNINHSIKYWFLIRAHKKVVRKKKLLGYSQVQSIGIIYDATSEENYRIITLLVKDLQQDFKKVKTLGFVAQKKMPDHAFPKLTFEFCNAKNFSFTQQPLTKNIKDFIAINYDILIDLTPSGFDQCKYLAAISGATMKVGRYVEEYVEVFDLMLQLDDNRSVKETSEQMLHYLNMINNGSKSEQ